MVELIPITLALTLFQEQKPTPADDEPVVRGLPDGDPTPLPERVHWDLAGAVTERTVARARVNVAGYWRFAPLLQREAPVARGEMGWIEMPGDWAGTAKVYDQRFRAADGLWHSRPLDEFPFAWAERDITISNSETINWLSRRIFLVVRGPWAHAEIYASQRSTKPGKSEPDQPPQTYVHVEPIEGADRDGSRWFELTESLVYPGTTQISLRLNRDAQQTEDNEPPKSQPYIGLELLPTGPRIEAIRLHRDGERGELQATFDLMRPKGFMIIPGPPIRTIPLTLKVRLDDAVSESNVHRMDHEIGTMPDHTRTVSLRIPWPNDKDRSGRARLRVRLASTSGRIFDESFPVSFRPADLDPVEDDD